MKKEPTPEPEVMKKEPTPEPEVMKKEPTPEPEMKAKGNEVDDDDDKMKGGELRELQTRKGGISAQMEESGTSVADPTCSKGVRNKHTCCPASCKKCGGEACSSRPGGLMCCEKDVRATGRMCKETSAPCMISL